MSDEKEYLGYFEELVMLGILRLGKNAYGASIRKIVSEATGRDASVGAVHITLERLERKGYVSSWRGEATPERGGRAKRYFRVEGAGEQALRNTEAARKSLSPKRAVGLA